jgi:hypothetical protein
MNIDTKTKEYITELEKYNKTILISTIRNKNFYQGYMLFEIRDTEKVCVRLI